MGPQRGAASPCRAPEALFDGVAGEFERRHANRPIRALRLVLPLRALRLGLPLRALRLGLPLRALAGKLRDTGPVAT